jgi:hypothetical protein
VSVLLASTHGRLQEHKLSKQQKQTTEINKLKLGKIPRACENGKNKKVKKINNYYYKVKEHELTDIANNYAIVFL